MQFQNNVMFFYFYFQETHQLSKHVTKTVNAVFSFVIFCLSPLPFESYEGVIFIHFIIIIIIFYFWGGEARVTYLYIFSFFRQIGQVEYIKRNKWKARKPSKNSFNYNLLIALLPVTKQIFVFIDTFPLGLSAQFFSLFAHQKEYLILLLVHRILLMPPGHLIIHLKSNYFNMAAASEKSLLTTVRLGTEPAMWSSVGGDTTWVEQPLLIMIEELSYVRTRWGGVGD